MPDTYEITIQRTDGVSVLAQEGRVGWSDVSSGPSGPVDTIGIAAFEEVMSTFSDTGSPLRTFPGTTGDSVAPIEFIRKMNLLANFRRWADAWKDETGHLSIEGEIASHEAYRNIVAMGAPAVPLILEDLMIEPDFWFIALHEITGELPEVNEDDMGDIDALADAWIEWGKLRGYID